MGRAPDEFLWLFYFELQAWSARLPNAEYIDLT